MKIGYLMQAGVPDVRQSPPSGAANHVRRVFQELTRLGHQVRLIACLEGGIRKSDDLDHYEPVSTERGSSPGRRIESLVRRIQYELRLPYFAWFDNRRFAEACCRELEGFEVLYERMGWMGGGGGVAARRMSVPHVLEVNGDHLSELETLGMAPQGLQKRASLRLMQKLASGAAFAVATGEGWRRRHQEHWRVPPDRTAVVQNGTDLVDLLCRDELRCFQVPRPAEPLRLVYAGSFEPWQGLPVLIGAIAESLRAGAPVRLTLAGSGRLEKDLRRQVYESGLTSYVNFAGHLPLPDLADLLAQSDAGLSLYSGRAEFTGLKLLDYKAAGLAVIATGQNGQPDLVKNGRTGLIVPPSDQAAVSRAILELACDRERTRNMGRRARLEAENEHRWEHTAKKLEEIFRQVLARQNA
jgi:alpha-maltose-1-phosphate synthase